MKFLYLVFLLNGSLAADKEIAAATEIAQQYMASQHKALPTLVENAPRLFALRTPSVARAPLAWDANGALTGLDTVDTVEFAPKQNTTFKYTVRGAGSGSNVLTVKIQQKKAGGGWQTRITKELNMPSETKSGSFKVNDYREGDQETIRFRFSRKVGTKAINWYVRRD
ncbi:hypothetical protein [Microbulbifer spongiae]|uniref:Uncharacterized protein n=1 Tax=Microbulbifer spongiae TaxID=2944933 RepID=A0ABY9ECF3_9GAMM|nr:hypothetical protein [Microbulbifer sp. MI-G]WKD50708.1 hypothetical protein M8T91_04575 [Microbulbifer sp. MI-G]